MFADYIYVNFVNERKNYEYRDKTVGHTLIKRDKVELQRHFFWM